jgi:D-cysteine desulfhydrase
MPRGGATAVGAVGFALAFDELSSQLDDTGADPGVIVVATGSGGTQAGLVAGRAGTSRAGTSREGTSTTGSSATGTSTTGTSTTGTRRRPRILGATVSRAPGQIRQTVVDLSQQCGALLGRPLARPEDVEIVDARGAGFGVRSEVGERARRIASETEGLILDPVYSAKAFAVVLGLVADGFSEPIVFWHTGGLPAAIHHQFSERSALCPT